MSKKKDVLTGLDMVHCALWQMKEEAERGSRIVNAKEMECILVILGAVMKDLGDKRFAKAEGDSK